MTSRKLFITVNIVAALFFVASCDQEEEEKVEPVNPTETVETPPAPPTPTTPISEVPSTPGSLIYHETLEGSTPFSTAHDLDVGDWEYALQYVASPVFKGTKSARFEIREDQPLVATGKRSEVTIVKGSLGHITKDTWYSFAVYFPSDGYEYDDEREVINQWYQDGSPATSLRTRRDRILLEAGNTQDSREQYDIAPIDKDKWHTFVLHFIHSYESDGLIEVWYDGVKKLTLKGGNMYDDILPKWKIGLYKSAFKYGTSDVSSRVIYFDNIMVGSEKFSFETMDPAL